MNFLSTILLMAPPSGSTADQSPWTMPLFLVGIFVVFYWFMIRPQAKKAKEQKKYIENLQKGEKIVTIAGIHGTINKVNEDGTLQLEVSPGSYIKIEKSSISQEMSLNLNKAAADKK